NELARGYYDENQRAVGAEAVAMAGDLRYFLQDMDLSSAEFQEQYGLQVYSRELNESAILQQAPDGGLRVVAIVDPSEDTTRERVSREALRQLLAGEEVVVTSNQNRTEAVTPIDRESGMYL